MSTAVRQVTAVFSMTGRAKHFPLYSVGTAVEVTAIRHPTQCSLTETFQCFGLIFCLIFQDRYPGERSGRFPQSGGACLLSAMHHVTGDTTDCHREEIQRYQCSSLYRA